MLLILSKLVWLTGVIGWYFIRRPYQRRANRAPIQTTARTKREMASLVASGVGLGLFPALVIFSGWFSFADRAHSWWLFGVGAICFAGALVLFRLTHKALGKFWSVSLDLREDHSLIVDGIYKFVRHPMYSGFWLWAIAQFLLLPNWLAGLSGIICFGHLYWQRVSREEDLMENEFGQEYRDYSARTGRLWPRKLFSRKS